MYEFGERIYNLRKKSGLSQEEYADKLGVSRQAVSKWETGQSVPDCEKAAAMAKFFGVSLDWLINGEESAAAQAITPVAAQEAAPDAGVETKKKKSGWLRAFIIAVAVSGTQNFNDPATFYMLLIVVPGWAVLFLVVFIISIIVIKKKRKK